MRMEELQTGFWGYQKEGVYKLIASMEESFSTKLMEKMPSIPARCKRPRPKSRNWRLNCVPRRKNRKRTGKIRISFLTLFSTHRPTPRNSEPSRKRGSGSCAVSSKRRRSGKRTNWRSTASRSTGCAEPFSPCCGTWTTKVRKWRNRSTLFQRMYQRQI